MDFGQHRQQRIGRGNRRVFHTRFEAVEHVFDRVAGRFADVVIILAMVAHVLLHGVQARWHEKSLSRGRSDAREAGSDARYGEDAEPTLSYGQAEDVKIACDAFFARRGLRNENTSFGYHHFRRTL